MFIALGQKGARIALTGLSLYFTFYKYNVPTGLKRDTAKEINC